MMCIVFYVRVCDVCIVFCVSGVCDVCSVLCEWRL